MSATNGHATAPDKAAAAENYRTVPIGLIRPWPGNPRKTFPQDGLDELAASLKTRGVLQPLLVRQVFEDSEDCFRGKNRINPRKVEGAFYEIADGERRYRAATLAGLTELPIRVFPLTDVDMLEIAVVSSEQREDVAPLEKAEGYRRLLAEGRTAEQIAESVGKSVSTVRGMLALLELPEAAREAVASGRLAKETATLITRVPGTAARERLARMVLCNVTWGDPTERETAVSLSDGIEPMSSRATKQLIHSKFMIPLKGSPFQQHDPTLPGGSCKECPKRAGNQPELVADGVRADVCTDPDCHGEKMQAWKDRELERAKGTGQKVLGTKEAKELFPYGTDLASAAPYFDLAEQCHHDAKKNRSYKQLLEGHISDADVVLCPDQKGVLHRLVPKDAALPVLRKEHGLFKGTSFVGSQGKTSEEEKKEAARQRFDNRVQRETVCDLLRQASEAASGAALFGRLPADDVPLNQILRVLAQEALARIYPTVLDAVADRHGFKGQRPAEQKESLKDLLPAMGAPQLLAFMVELCTVDCVVGYREKEGAKEWREALGLYPKTTEKEVRARLKGEKAAKKGGKKRIEEAAPEQSPIPPGSNGNAEVPRKRGRPRKAVDDG